MSHTRRSFLAASIATTVALSGARPLRSETPKLARDPFTLGVASGYPTSDSVVLWTRLAPSPMEPGGGVPPGVVPVDWQLASDDKMTRIVRSGTEYATPDWAHSVHVEPTGLEPAREYWYRFSTGEYRSPIGRTRTAPARGAPLAKLSVAVASCQQYEHGYFSAYRHMLAAGPDLIVHTGDYIYEGTWGDHLIRSHGAPETFTLEDYRRRYALYKSDRDLAAAHAACPWLVTWDDHEVSNDYAGSTAAENDEPELFLARRAAAYRAYYEHMPLPRQAVPFGANMRLHAQRAFGDLCALFMLDQRQHRAPQACPPLGRRGGNRVSPQECPELTRPARQMLGERQESWLLAGLGRSRARWNLLGQGTVMSHLNEQAGREPRYWTDAWNGYPAARDRIIEFMAEQRVANPVVLSGDIHAFLVSGLRRKAADMTSPVVASELVTTSISSQGVPRPMLDKWRTLNPNLLVIDGEHRGYLRVVLTHERLQAELIGLDSVKNVDSKARTLRSFVIEAGRPGPVPA
jgi:alkaline phosphatase D